jgi:hypothetical protein
MIWSFVCDDNRYGSFPKCWHLVEKSFVKKGNKRVKPTTAFTRQKKKYGDH